MRLSICLLVWVLVAMQSCAGLYAQSVESNQDLYNDHSDLLVIRNAAGESQPVKNTDDWAKRVVHIRQGMERAMGKLPDVSKKVDLNVRELSSEKTDKYLRKKIRFTPEANDEVPAWLLIPHDAKQHGQAAMLCLHQTVAIGKDEPAGLGGKPTLHYAHELANRGYVCIVPDYPSFVNTNTISRHRAHIMPAVR